MEVKIKQKVQIDEKLNLINRTGYSFVSWEEKKGGTIYKCPHG